MKTYNLHIFARQISCHDKIPARKGLFLTVYLLPISACPPDFLLNGADTNIALYRLLAKYILKILVPGLVFRFFATHYVLTTPTN